MVIVTMHKENEMNRRFQRAVCSVAAGLALFTTCVTTESLLNSSRAAEAAMDTVNRRHYYLDSWMGAIGLPDDPFKPVVDADGTFWIERGKSALRQGIYPLALYQSPIKIHARLKGTTQRVDQRMYSPRVPISIAHKKQGPVAIEETLFLAAPLDWSASVTGEGLKGRDSLPRPRRYLLMTEYTNNGDKPAEITPVLDLQGAAPGPNLDDNTKFQVAWNTYCRTTLPIAGFESWESGKTMNMPSPALKTLTIPPGGQTRWVLTINRNGFDNSGPVEWAEAEKLRDDAISYWVQTPFHESAMTCHLTLEEREMISRMHYSGSKQADIARRLGRLLRPFPDSATAVATATRPWRRKPKRNRDAAAGRGSPRWSGRNFSLRA